LLATTRSVRKICFVSFTKADFTEIGLGSPVSQRPGRNSPPQQQH
jgi:hypothetical protein